MHGGYVLAAGERRAWRCPAGMRRAAAVMAALVAFGAGFVAGAGVPAGAGASAQTPAVVGEAYGHFTNVSLFGGPTVASPPSGPAPKVELPAAGSAQPLTAADNEGAVAKYGPASIFAGIWPANVAQAPSSGPISVRTQGAPGGTVTSTADIGLWPQPKLVACSNDAPGKATCAAPGGFGPMPVTQGEQLHSTCSATPQGVTGEATFVKAQLAKSTNPDGEPTGVENVPDKPPVNYTQTGTITNVGDNWKVVFNEQTRDADGSLTVNAIHVFLLGPTAVGESILGHVRCAMSGVAAPASTSPVTTVAATAPPTTAAPATTAAPSSIATKPASSSKAVPITLAGVGALVIIGLVATLAKRRSKAPPASI